MTPPAPPPSPVRTWHRNAALLSVAWGLIELGVSAWFGGAMLFSLQEPTGLPLLAMTVLFLDALGCLILPAIPLLVRRRLSLATYQLAAVPPALCLAFILIMLVSVLIHDGLPEYYVVALLLVFVLGRGAPVAALLSVSRLRARMYGP